jgi:thymidylate synthase
MVFNGDILEQNDQLYNLIKVLIQEPYSRRHLLTTYNPSMVEQSVLAPCHGLVIQFYVQNEYLDCKMYQRSCDTVLGEPFNITSYALLTHLIAYICGYKARKLIITLGDAHIYEQHIEGVREQMKRKPYMFPKLNIKKKYEGYENMKIEDRIRYLESLVFDDIEVVDYECYPSIKFDMVA